LLIPCSQELVGSNPTPRALNFANIELDNVFLHAISNKLFEVVIK
jgi:hypothetical protein